MKSRREFWRRLVDELRTGEPLAEVARRHRVHPRTLSWWKWRLRDEPAVEPRLLPVVVRGASIVATASVHLRIGDVRIRVRCGTDVEYVAALMAALRR